MRDWEKKPNFVLKTPPLKHHPLLSGGKQCLLGAVAPSPAVGHDQGQQMSQELPGMRAGQAAVTVMAKLCLCGQEELQLLHYRVACVHMMEEPQNIQCLSCRTCPSGGHRQGHRGGRDVLKATQKRASRLHALVVLSGDRQGLHDTECGHSSSQKATLALSGTCCLSKAICADAPGGGCRDVCRRGWVSTRASDASVLPLVPQQLPLPALQLAPSLPPCRDSQEPHAARPPPVLG